MIDDEASREGLADGVSAPDVRPLSVLSTARGDGLTDSHREAAAMDPEATLAPLEPHPHARQVQETPRMIGRYPVEGVLGEGSFGVVYLARDEQLQRPVAIKVARLEHLAENSNLEAYLEEARVVARLEHPGIVPVYDVGQSPDGAWFVVSKYLPGGSLEGRLRKGRMAFAETAEFIAAAAEALHHAHRHGVVHRDVKPANILLDGTGRPCLADFGLALLEKDLGKGSGYAGTPAYMSPEQARGESHRVDGRSDVFSLGVVLYELLAGKRPFRGDVREIVTQICSVEARPPRQLDDTIPKELERICLKALSKRATDRYSTAKDMAEDLRCFGDESLPKPPPHSPALPATQPASPDLATVPSPAPIVPKGLRSFDAEDADFFLELLPGPHHRDGLPESLRFWKTRIEATDPDRTFTVGLMYGPSGCGKSSLMKAGLLPRLAPEVLPIYLEATPDDTETRLLNALRRRSPALSSHQSLRDTLAVLRTGRLGAGQKILLVIDQFEQWLHAHREEPHTELALALRHCDGEHVQCILMVRDDFWMAVTRFMRELEVDLVQGRNMAAVDLFDTLHARKVLAEFGRAYGRLPSVLCSLREQSPSAPRGDSASTTPDLTPEQNAFLDEALAGLAEEGKVVSVRLALFAEMVKGKPWTPATLKAVGGARGVGVTFLEETFAAKTASPKHRLHQKAAQLVLRRLLPESGADIKGHLRSEAELRAASGYADRPQDFAELLQTLDQELRLITPTDLEGATEGEAPRIVVGTLRVPSPAHEVSRDAPSSNDEATGGKNGTRSAPTTLEERYYQLTHDYLVPSLREWLTRKQRETRRGRAELRLADRAALWTHKPERRHLPSLWEYANIRWHTRKKDWTGTQRRMMAQAARMHLLHWGSALAALVIVIVAIQQFLAAQRLENDRRRAESLVHAMLTAPSDAAPYAIENLAPLSELATPMLRDRLDDAEADPTQRLHAALALAAFGQPQVEYLVSQVVAQPQEMANLVVALAPVRTAALAAIRRTAEDLVSQAAAAPDAGNDYDSLRAETRLAVAALYLGDTHLAEDMCRSRPDPIERTIFIDEFPTCRGDLTQLAQRADALDDPSLRYAVCLGVGGAMAEGVAPEERQAWQAILTEWYQRQPDAGTHAGAGWALRQGRIDLPEIAVSAQLGEGLNWHVNSVGMTMVEIPAGSFYRTDAYRRNPTENDQKVLLTRSFLLSDYEISVGLFQKFVEDPDYPADEKPEAWQRHQEKVSPTSAHPVNMVNWYDAVLFCNWLSRKEELRPCYERTEEKEEIIGEKHDQWRWLPEANGYRLPTEAEWEYVCRAGSRTAYFFGDDEALLSRYAVYNASRAESCGAKRPNTFGLFDMHGNMYEWCQDWTDGYGSSPAVDPQGPVSGSARVLRGGSWADYARYARSAFRNRYEPANRNFYLGFRAARTP